MAVARVFVGSPTHPKGIGVPILYLIEELSKIAPRTNGMTDF